MDGGDRDLQGDRLEERGSDPRAGPVGAHSGASSGPIGSEPFGGWCREPGQRNESRGLNETQLLRLDET